MSKSDRLRHLQVSKAGQNGIELALGNINQAALQATNLANVLAFRNAGRPGDLLIDAQIQMLQGNEAQALARLTDAVDLGFNNQLKLSVLTRMLGIEDSPIVRDIEQQIADRRLTEQALALQTLAQR